MAKIFGQLEKAQGENLTSDPTGTGLVAGRIWFRTDLSSMKYYDGATVRILADRTTPETLQNKTLDNTTTLTMYDDLFTLQDELDDTKQMRFENSGITTGNTRVLTVPDANTTILGTDATQVVTNKDIDGGTASNARRITLPKETTTNLDALTDKEATVAYDTTLGVPVYNNGSVWQSMVGGSYSAPNTYENLGIQTTVAANALTIALKQLDGTTDPTTGSGSVKIAFRNSTNSSGGVSVVGVTAALSTVISSGSTAGHTSADQEWLYIYALNNSGTVELAWSSSLFDCSVAQSTTAEGGAGGADSATTLYSTTARASVPITLIGKVRSTQATAGTWVTAPAVVSTQEFPRYTLGSVQTFSSSGTWTRPSGCRAVKVTVIGGGGGGGGAAATGATTSSDASGGGGGGGAIAFITRGLGATETITIGTGASGGAAGANAGSTGGTSSFGAHASATGGGGGSGGGATAGSNAGSGGLGGSGSGGFINPTGGDGSGGKVNSGITLRKGDGGPAASVQGGGGGVSVVGGSGSAGKANGGGGSGGSLGNSASAVAGGDGADGRVIVEEYY